MRKAEVVPFFGLCKATSCRSYLTSRSIPSDEIVILAVVRYLNKVEDLDYLIDQTRRIGLSNIVRSDQFSLPIRSDVGCNLQHRHAILEFMGRPSQFDHLLRAEGMAQDDKIESLTSQCLYCIRKVCGYNIRF